MLAQADPAEHSCNAGSFTVTAALTDTLAGLARVAFPDTTSPGTSYALSGLTSATRFCTYTFTVASTFSATTFVTATDRATNLTTAPFTVTRDTTPPTLTLTPAVEGGALRVTWSATDAASGVDGSTCELRVREDEGAWQPFSTACAGDEVHTAAQPGHVYTFRVTATDNVGNSTSTEAQAGVPRVTKYYYSGGRRVAMRVGGVVYYLHADHLGSVSLVTNHASEPVAEQRFLPYGGLRWSEGTLPTDFGFAGQRDVPGTGLIFMHARYYLPGLGRFVSADTMVPIPANPQDLNRFAYAGNNPLRYVDPSGHAEQCTGDCPSKLTDEQLEIVQSMAEEFGIPPELLAAVLNTERVYDTEWYDFFQNAYQQAVVAYARGDIPAWPVKKQTAEDFAFIQMVMWEVFWKPGAQGVGPGLGLGHVHTGPAREVENYFAERGLSDLLPETESSTELWGTLLSDEGNIRYVAASLRRLVEIRQGGGWEYGQITPINSMSVNDAEIIMDAYWWGVESYGTGGYSLYEFQIATVPKHENGLLIGCSYGYYQQYFAEGE